MKKLLFTLALTIMAGGFCFASNLMEKNLDFESVNFSPLINNSISANTDLQKKTFDFYGRCNVTINHTDEWGCTSSTNYSISGADVTEEVCVAWAATVVALHTISGEM